MVDKAVVCAACARGIGLLDRAVLFVHPVHLVHDRVEPLGEAPLVGIGQLRRVDGKAVPAQDVVVLGGDQLVDRVQGGLRPNDGEGRSRQGGVVPPNQGVNLVQRAVVPGHRRAHLGLDAGHLRACQVGRLPVHKPVLGQYGVVLGVQGVHAGCHVGCLLGARLAGRAHSMPVVHGAAYGRIGGRRGGAGGVCRAVAAVVVAAGRCRHRRGHGVGALIGPRGVPGDCPGGKRHHEGGYRRRA